MVRVSNKNIYRKYILIAAVCVVACTVLFYIVWNQGYLNKEDNMCKYISSRGILKSCDIHSPDPKSSVLTIQGIDITKIREGSTVYVPGSAIPDFIRYMNKIPYRFILVSGDCDETIPTTAFRSQEDFQIFIESEKIVHWYSQNCVGRHPKLTQIPIGLDYHTRVKSDRWGPTMSSVKQEKEIEEIKAKAKPFYQRELKAYANFHFNMQEDRTYTQDRRDAKVKIPSESVYYEPSFTRTRKETMEKQIKYAFVVSPHGNGLDCIRTWEALVLGCIPVVKTSGIDSLYDDLPVLIVQDWEDLSQDLMRSTIESFKHKTYK